MPNRKDFPVADHNPPTPPKTTRANRKRLNLDLSQEAYDLLQELSEDTGKNMAEVLRTGLALYGIAREEKKKGRSLGVIEDDRIIKELVIT
jgi:hypothetical protein